MRSREEVSRLAHNQEVDGFESHPPQPYFITTRKMEKATESYESFISMCKKATTRYIGFQGLLSQISGIDRSSLSLHISGIRTMSAETYFTVRDAYWKAIQIAPTKLKERKANKNLLSRKK